MNSKIINSSIVFLLFLFSAKAQEKPVTIELTESPYERNDTVFLPLTIKQSATTFKIHALEFRVATSNLTYEEALKASQEKGSYIFPPESMVIPSTDQGESNLYGKRSVQKVIIFSPKIQKRQIAIPIYIGKASITNLQVEVYSLANKKQPEDILLHTGYYFSENESIARKSKKQVYPFRDTNSLYGYKDLVGNIVAQPAFDDAEEFLDSDLAVVRINDLYGYIDKSGKIAIEPNFKNAENFGNAPFARITQNKKIGYINKNGDIVIEPRFYIAKDFDSHGQAIVNQQRGGKYGIINLNGDFVVSPTYKQVYSQDGYNLIQVQAENGKWGYIDRQGKVVVEPVYDYVSGFYNGSGMAYIELNDKKGYINQEGKVVIEPQFDEAYYFNEFGTAVVGVDFKNGVINKSGEYIIKPEFDAIYPDYGYSDFCRIELGGNIGCINKSGEIVIAPQFSYMEPFDESGLALVGKDGKYGFIDKKGKIKVKINLERASAFENWELAIVEKGGYTTMINKKGKECIKPYYGFMMEHFFNKDEVRVPNLKIARIEQDYGYGLINSNGNIIAEPYFEDIELSKDEKVLYGYLGDGSIELITLDGNFIGFSINEVKEANYSLSKMKE